MKKGFTLIELLAVIIILGLLSILIVPKTIKTLDDSEQKTNLASAEGLLKAAEYKYQDNELKGINEQIIVNYTANTNVDKLDYSGAKPEKGEVKIMKNGKIAMAVKIGNNCYAKDLIDKEIDVKPYNQDTCIIKAVKLISDADNNGVPSIGDEYAIGNEHFYLLRIIEEYEEYEEGDAITIMPSKAVLLSKYNLLAGNEVWDDNSVTEISSTTQGYGKQDASSRGWEANEEIYIGTTKFSNNVYWYDYGKERLEYGDDYPAYVYDVASSLYPYIQNYIEYLKEQDAPNAIIGRLINLGDLSSVSCDVTTGCNSNTPAWFYSTSYWTGITVVQNNVIGVRNEANIEKLREANPIEDNLYYGIRPVIEIDPSEL